MWHTASLLRGSGHWIFFYLLPHYLPLVDNKPTSIDFLGAVRQWAMALLLHTAFLPWGSGQPNAFRTLRHSLGVVGSRHPSVHSLIALG